MANEESLQETLNQIGSRLKDLRKKKGYTSAETFSYDFDLPRVHYWRIESGKANLTVKTLLRILSIHRMDIADFFSGWEKDD